MNRNPLVRRALGRVLRAWREELGLSQEALAHRAHVDRTWVGTIERGESNLSIEGTHQFLGALGRTWTELGRALDAEPGLTPSAGKVAKQQRPVSRTPTTRGR